MPISENKGMVTSQVDKNQPQKVRNQEHLINGNVCSIPRINVELAIQKSIRNTQAMKIFLTSLRDDLKAKKQKAPQDLADGDEQTKKRKEVADKLENAYIGYKTTLTEIFELVKKPRLTAPSASIGPSSSMTCEVIELSESDEEDNN